ncbi:hypothetical protein [Candidatus Rhodobacter oscarellae]|uniref:hypothetical protein n=1 Tax=Candidatus Rhodobacter oscarellae TaxID=1675527 RepID=UPI00128EED7A|nr:hypothetical protein [Candidatus Rhodobacter lobularis]
MELYGRPGGCLRNGTDFRAISKNTSVSMSCSFAKAARWGNEVIQRHRLERMAELPRLRQARAVALLGSTTAGVRKRCQGGALDAQRPLQANYNENHNVDHARRVTER